MQTRDQRQAACGCDKIYGVSVNAGTENVSAPISGVCGELLNLIELGMNMSYMTYRTVQDTGVRAYLNVHRSDGVSVFHKHKFEIR